MTKQFDAHDRASWYFGHISRQEATDLLMNETESGAFLVRDSSSMLGDYVLCVREDSKVSHYIINKLVQQNDEMKYRIGDQIFEDLPKLLEFYKIHYLDTTPLIKPAALLQNVTAKFDFRGNDPDDLPFKKGDILTVISKDEDQWWTAKNCHGQIGSIPVPYVQPCEWSKLHASQRDHSSSFALAPRDPAFSHTQRDPAFSQMHRDHAAFSPSSTVVTSHPPAEAAKKATWQKKLPALARVKQVRIPNAYDKTALKLEVGDIIKVTKMNINGQWEGELNGKTGNFPFTHVEFLDSEINELEEKAG